MKVGFLQHLHLLISVVAILILKATFVQSTNTSSGVIRCLGNEREALLKFKDELIDENGRLSSWGNEKDCCKWTGIRCHNKTNNVIMLDLQGGLWGSSSLRGKISPWLLKIQHLEYLDLSFNDFNYSRIPQFIGSLRRLQYLDLSNSNFGGLVTPHLRNLSQLQYLRLGGMFDLLTMNVDWLSQLHSLRYLGLVSINLTMATNWFQAINKLTQLQALQLVLCHLPMVPIPKPFMLNASDSIHSLVLYGNEFTSSWIFPWLFNISAGSLRHLALEQNNLQGPIPDAIGNLVSLSYLSLSYNQFEGRLPLLGNLSSLSHLDLSNNKLTGILSNLTALPSYLTYLDLSVNMFNGSIPQSIGSLSKLKILQLDLNHFEGMISESHFFNLSHLQFLGLGHNSGISFNFSLGWKPPFQLTNLYIADCMVGPHFPIWLRTQRELGVLYISNAGIEGALPNWFWELTPKFYDLDMSNNNFNGSLPTLHPNAFMLDLSGNKFSGPVTNLCIEANMSINWNYLDLSNNHLSGQLPECLAILPRLDFLNLAHNNFSGKIPSLNTVYTLHLQNNGFTGEIPKSLRNNTSLTFIDLSENNLSGKIPLWVGDTWTKLVFLSLRSNGFIGTIPSSLCHLASLQVLDLSLNKLNGGIPKCINNLTALNQKADVHEYAGGYKVDAYVTWKGIELQYEKTLRLVKLIDLSRNNLVGDIPQEITSLVALVGLNLSRNNLSGFLPAKIGQLRSLDFLDLSRNHFDGGIPTGLSELDQLGVLDLSHNNLSGKIPQSIHLVTFGASPFEENPGLCGPPLSKACPGDEITPNPKIFVKTPEKEDKFFCEGFYISLAIGFPFGFWGVFASLLFNKSWRFAFFKSWNRTSD